MKEVLKFWDMEIFDKTTSFHEVPSVGPDVKQPQFRLFSREKVCKVRKKKLKLRVTYIWSNRWRSVGISWKLVVMPKLSPFQNSRTTYKSNLTCIFLSVGLKLLFTFQYEMPCSKNPNENRGLIAFELCKHVLQFK